MNALKNLFLLVMSIALFEVPLCAASETPKPWYHRAAKKINVHFFSIDHLNEKKLTKAAKNYKGQLIYAALKAAIYLAPLAYNHYIWPEKNTAWRELEAKKYLHRNYKTFLHKEITKGVELRSRNFPTDLINMFVGYDDESENENYKKILDEITQLSELYTTRYSYFPELVNVQRFQQNSILQSLSPNMINTHKFIQVLEYITHTCIQPWIALSKKYYRSNTPAQFLTNNPYYNVQDQRVKTGKMYKDLLTMFKDQGASREKAHDQAVWQLHFLNIDAPHQSTELNMTAVLNVFSMILGSSAGHSGCQFIPASLIKLTQMPSIVRLLSTFALTSDYAKSKSAFDNHHREQLRPDADWFDRHDHNRNNARNHEKISSVYRYYQECICKTSDVIFNALKLCQVTRKLSQIRAHS